jgi:hypothetical protein
VLASQVGAEQRIAGQATESISAARLAFLLPPPARRSHCSTHEHLDELAMAESPAKQEEPALVQKV